ncbi:MAG: ATP-NAD kinase family protein [Candidatus Lokiarchaeota archaeon]|nr:ATP-NAD kinase family protein [Candidatus Lokiarchaeota archaeon]
MERKTTNIGLLLNPISGMGGSVGLKGTDGIDVLQRAQKLGAVPKIQDRTEIFLITLNSLSNDFEIITPPGIMGEEICERTNTSHKVIPRELFGHELLLFQTTKEDTQIAAKYFLDEKVDLLIFIGGDGTARDILEVIDQHIPCLGVPGGVKVFSSVFTVNPKLGAELTARFINGKVSIIETEVVDIDEQAFRENRIQMKIYGYMKIPHVPLLIQGTKQSTSFTDEEKDNQIAIARSIIDDMEQDIFYILGPGTTVQKVAELLNTQKTLLGFDIIKNRELVAIDVNEQKILNIINDEPTALVISPIGRQGFVFGRGNLQITPEVMQKIPKENIHILCTKSKVQSLPNGYLRTDIRDPTMDEQLRGFYRVLVDFKEYRIIKMI